MNLGAIVAITVGVAKEGPAHAVALLAALLGSVAFVWGLYRARNRVVIYGVVVVTPSIQMRAIATPDLGRMQPRLVVPESVVAGFEVALDDALDGYAIVGRGVDGQRS